MATAPPKPHPMGPDSLIIIKVSIDNINRRFKLALRDLGAHVLPQKLRFLLVIPPDAEVKFERFSDSAGSYVTLDSSNPAIYKQLYRAAKAKGKLRIKATITQKDQENPTELKALPASAISIPIRIQTGAKPRQTFLETVLTHPGTMTKSEVPLKTVQLSKAAPMPPPAVNRPTSGPGAGLSQPTLPGLHHFYGAPFSINCNECGRSVPNEHFHCSICEKGDFDLCQSCVDAGILCQDDKHWLIKRTIHKGVVVPSKTQKVSPKTNRPDNRVEELEKLTSTPEPRTCNACIETFPAMVLVTCNDCADFDLCFFCFEKGEHGHHPAHVFRALDTSSPVPFGIASLLPAGRDLIHEAICDGCDKHVQGVRHKCLTCPDFDYCSECILSAEHIHPGHRFAPLYAPISGRIAKPVTHFGVHCDGPLCRAHQSRSYIRGVRYKCAICDDTDFCATCEALPDEHHNKTHPLIKFNTPVHGVSITTLHGDKNGQHAAVAGDRAPSTICKRARNAATETTPLPQQANAATQVRTLAEVKPAESAPMVKYEEVEPKKEEPVDLQAWFVTDSTPDGSRVEPGHLVSQSWTMRNAGDQAWPAGCAVYFVGGDDMRNLDTTGPSSVSAMVEATRSTILEESLQPGKTADFKVTLKAPKREGRVISYWRLKTPDGMPFGHKLWVDLNVAMSPTQTPKPAASPAIAAPTKLVSIPVEGDETVDSEASSTMIFPKLEKESPEASVHEDVVEVPAEPNIKTEDQELLEDIESLELDDTETDGFMTDEEYDILDASDEDFLLEAHKAVARQ